jgi:hypothetical protein
MENGDLACWEACGYSRVQAIHHSHHSRDSYSRSDFEFTRDISFERRAEAFLSSGGELKNGKKILWILLNRPSMFYAIRQPPPQTCSTTNPTMSCFLCISSSSASCLAVSSPMEILRLGLIIYSEPQVQAKLAPCPFILSCLS